MKKYKRTIAILLVALLCIGLSGCGNSPQDKVMAALKNMENAQSVDSQMKMVLEASIMGQEMDMTMGVSGSSFNEPMKTKMDVSLDISAQGVSEHQNTLVYVIQDGDIYNVYTDDGSGSLSHVEMNMEEFESSQAGSSNTFANFKMIMNFIKSFQAAGNEEIDGIQTEKFNGVISGSDMKKIMEQTMASSGVDSMTDSMDGITQQMLEELGDLPVTIWVDTEQMVPLRLEMDMAPMFEKIMERVAEESGLSNMSELMSFDTIKFTLDCRNFNNATEFEIPSENL